MAATLTSPNADALTELIEQLAPTMAPQAAGLWPLAPIYWLVLILLLVLLGLGVWWHRRTRLLRRYKRVLQRLTQIDEPVRQLQQLHALLRNAAAQQSAHYKSLSDREFARLVAEHLERSEPPDWVNAHYRPKPAMGSAFDDAEQLVRRWCR